MDFSPVNPMVWILALGVVVVVWGVVRIFAMLHPDYPEIKNDKSDWDMPDN
jgi:hypothetical protein